MIKNCKHCNKEFIATCNRVFCDIDCKLLHSGAYRDYDKFTICPVCFSENHRGGVSKYCSADCKIEMERLRRKWLPENT